MNDVFAIISLPGESGGQGEFLAEKLGWSSFFDMSVEMANSHHF